MEVSFAVTFGNLHIGTNKEKSSHIRVTDLEFIRWRATVFGTEGQRILGAIRARKVAASLSLVSSSLLSNSIAKIQ